MELKNGIQTYHAESRSDWRKWLEQNHDKDDSLWLIIYHKKSSVPCVGYEESVEEALCFGWVDSRTNKRDGESYYIYYCKRKPTSYWSRSNRERVERLTEQGLMTEAGQALINLAKEKGTWLKLEEIDNLLIPPDLQKEFDNNQTAYDNFMAFRGSSKKIILGWISLAKHPVTRQKRIEETVEMAEKNIKANHYVQ